MIKYIKRFKLIVNNFLYCYSFFSGNLFKKKFILMNTPQYSNLGDHAIAKAEIKFFHDYYQNVPLIELPGEILRKYFKYFKYFIKKKDFIFITGGGYLGNLWIREEMLVRDIIESYPNNNIFILPQTVYFTNDEKGINEKSKTISIYNNHKHLNVFLRDKRSYDFFEKYLKNIKSYYVPDIVLYLNESTACKARNGILFCLRKDLEKTFNSKEVIKYFNNKHEIISYTDTVINETVSVKDRDIVLEKKFNEFRLAKMVVTDRLHGMIFAAITGTPCIAFDNISKKVSGVYKWIESLEYIKVVSSFEEFVEAYNYISNLNNEYFNYSFDVSLFQEIHYIIDKI